MISWRSCSEISAWEETGSIPAKCDDLTEFSSFVNRAYEVNRAYQWDEFRADQFCWQKVKSIFLIKEERGLWWMLFLTMSTIRSGSSPIEKVRGMAMEMEWQSRSVLDVDEKIIRRIHALILDLRVINVRRSDTSVSWVTSGIALDLGRVPETGISIWSTVIYREPLTIAKEILWRPGKEKVCAWCIPQMC